MGVVRVERLGHDSLLSQLLHVLQRDAGGMIDFLYTRQLVIFIYRQAIF